MQRSTLWALLACTAGVTAQAQSAPPPASGGSAAVNGDGSGQQSGPRDGVEEIVVTAQKRSETLQSVPISIQALSTQRLAELNISQATDLIKFLPSVSTQSPAPGFAKYYFRGVASGGDGNHSGPLPSVGVYLDEQPVTTIQGPVDIHFYDIARVEALAGPQGTLYGASAEAGVLRFITNKPDPTRIEAGVDLEGNKTTKGGFGYQTEAFINLPLSERAALRVVGWYQRDAGFIDIVAGSRTYPVSGVTVNTTPRKDSNQSDLYGGRAALKIDLNDRWTVTPSIQGQEQILGGRFGYDARAGDLAVKTFYPERSKDSWFQAAGTIEGKIHNFDLVYAGSYLQRTVNSTQDYTDYSFAYDTLFGSGAYITDSFGNPINPSQQVFGNDAFQKESHELRLSSPQDKRVRGVLGLFYQRQQHDIEQIYFIDGFAAELSNTGRPGTIWLTEQKRVDRDYAIFGEASIDLVPEHLTLTGGARVFRYDNTLYGYFGYGRNFSSRTGESRCDFSKPALPGAFCTNLDQGAKGDGITPRVNLTYKFNRDHLLYFTYSRGFRPGGVNRRGGQLPYLPDFLTNFEVGSKNTFLNRRLTLNVTAFYEKWKNFQFSFLGANGLTEIRNLIGAAEIYGIESDVTVVPVRGLTISGGLAYIDARTANAYCGTLDAAGAPITVCPGAEQAPRGQQLPVTPEFKFNLTGRYSFEAAGAKWYAQGSVQHQSSSFADLRTIERSFLGRLPAYQNVDFRIGAELPRRVTVEAFVQNALDSRGQITRYAECAAQVCANPLVQLPTQGTIYQVPIRPQLFGFRIGKRY